jgi:hypothetical protein
MIVILLLVQLLPSNETFLYETFEKEKIDTMQVVMRKDSLGYHIWYTSDRKIEVILDSITLGTRYVHKIVGGKQELKISWNEKFHVRFKGNSRSYREDGPVYDRHTADFAFRGFAYTPDFDTIIRFHVPELMIINANVRVVGEDVVTTPFGEIPCWHVRLVPRVFFLKMHVDFWYEKDYPYRFIRLQDASGSRGIRLIKQLEE